MSLKQTFVFFTSSRVKFITALILGLYCLFGFFLRWQTLDFFFFNEWVARDFDRAFNLFEGIYIPLAGPELNNGGRLPGPFLYFLMAIPLFINKSFESIAQFNFLLNLLAVVVMFAAIKKHFGFFVASLFTVLISIYLPHINVFGYPINPSFIFPFVALYIWCLLDLIANKNEKCFPLIILIVSLGIQMHYSMSTFYATPFFLLILYKIKISRRYILLTLLVLLFVFSPYLVYKSQTFIPGDPLKDQFNPLKIVNFLSLDEALSVIFIKKTMFRITYNNGLEARHLFKNSMVLIYYFLIYSSLIYWAIRIYKKGIEFYKKELVIFATFYVPAVIYEVTRPFMSHLWYCYIFIFPSFLIVALFACEVFGNLKNVALKSAFFIFATILILFSTHNTYKEFNDYKTEGIKKDFQHTYQNTNFFLQSILNHLDISNENFYKRVFIDFDNFALFSKRRLGFINRTDKAILNDKKAENNKSCFYVHNLSFKKERFRYEVDTNNPRWKTLIADKSIKITSTKKDNLKIVYKGHVIVLGIITYIPKNKGQPCYTNNQSPFAVDNETKNLLIETKPLSDKQKHIVVKVLTSERNFDKNSELVSLNEEYLIYKQTIQAPIKFKVNIRKTGNSYEINTKINLFSYFLGKKLTLKDLTLNITDSSVPTNENYRFNIVNDRSFVQELMGYNPYSIRLDWQKSFQSSGSLKFKEKLFTMNLGLRFGSKDKYENEAVEENIQSLNIPLSGKLERDTIADGDNLKDWRKLPPFFNFLWQI